MGGCASQPGCSLPHRWDVQSALLYKKATKSALGGTSPLTVSFSLAAWARCEHLVQAKLSTKALQVRDLGTFQQRPTDLHPPETSFYKSAALQLGGERGGERHVLSSARVKVSMRVHTYMLPLSPSCCHGAGISMRGTNKQVRAGPSFSCSGRGGPGWQRVPLIWGTHPTRLSQPAQRAESLLPGHGETGGEGQARPSLYQKRAAAPPGLQLSHPIFLHPPGFPSWVPASPMTLR